MPRFSYAALDTKGQTVTGEVLASDNREALTHVRELGYFPTGINEIISTPQTRLHRKVSRADIALSIRQLANLVGAGLPVHRALVVLSEQTDSAPLRALLEEAKAEVRAGGSLSSALSHFPREFPPLAINLIQVGESTGALDQALNRLADLVDKSLQRRSQIISSLTYPVLLIVVAISASIFLISFLIPKLSPTLREFHMALPLPTLMLLRISDAVTRGWWIGLIIIAALIFTIWYSLRHGGARWFEIRIQRLPMLGKLFARIAAARLARTMGAMLAGGVPILESLEIAASGAGSLLASEAMAKARDQVKEGVPLATALANAGGFLPALIHVSAVGEETGRLPDLLLRLADGLDFEVDTYLRRLISLMEPAIIILMGLIVGFIVLAILLPIFSLGSSMG